MIPYLRAANIKDSELALADVLEMNFQPAEQAKYNLRAGDVLVTEGCGSLGQIGASARWSGEIPSPIGFQNTLLRFRAIEGITDPGFVYHWARWAYESGAFADAASGTSIFHIGAKRAAAMLFPDIPLSEQRRIADFFDALESTVKASRVSVEQARSLRRALLADAHRQAVEAASVTTTLGELATVISGASWAKGDECDASAPKAVAAIRVANMKNDRLDLDDLRYIRPSAEALRKPVHHPAVMLVRTNTVERVGNAQFVPPAAAGFVYSSFLILVAPADPADAEYIGRFLQAPQVQSEISANASGSTAGLKNVPVTWLRRLELPIVDTKRREAIFEPIRAVESATGSLESRLSALKEFQSSALTALFTGKRGLPDTYDRFISQETSAERELLMV